MVVVVVAVLVVMMMMMVVVVVMTYFAVSGSMGVHVDMTTVVDDV